MPVTASSDARGVSLTITADHGMVDVPLEARPDIATDADLDAGVRHVSGEPRCVQLHVRPGARDDVVDTSRAGFDAYLTDRARQGDTTVAPPEGFVHCSYFWVLDGPRAGEGDIVGFLALRHTLTEVLYEAIGHIGYSVRPSARGRGVAAGALMLGLDEARALGVEQVLVCCSTENPASRAVIEKCGGQFEDVRSHPAFPGETRRYWFGSPPFPQGPTA